MRVFIPPFRKRAHSAPDHHVLTGSNGGANETAAPTTFVKVDSNMVSVIPQGVPPAVTHGRLSLAASETTVPSNVESSTGSQPPAALSTDFVGYEVLYTKRSLKKRKTDGVLLVKAGSIALLDDAGMVVAKSISKGGWSTENGPGSSLVLGNFELELCEQILEEEYSSGRLFIGNCASTCAPTGGPQAKAPRRFQAPLVSTQLFQPVATTVVEKGVPHGAFEIAVCETPSGERCPIWIDAFLNKYLRPHQREGISWMYNQLLEGGGCILADTMGLGKTIQAISLLWVAVSQPAGLRPLATKCCVVCPASLVGNWTHEVKKWLGNRLTFVVASGDGKETKAILQQFTSANICKLVIVSYDQLRKLCGTITSSIDILICDEGHRLKSSKSQTALHLQKLRCRHRLILSGTPLQNDMDELYACCSFVRPDAIPDNRVFAKVFKEPILRAGLPTATVAEKQLGQRRAEELTSLLSRFMLRRTDDVLKSFVPPKKTVAIYLNLLDKQRFAYETVCKFALKGELRMHSKMQFLENLLLSIRSSSDDKVVIVSNFTSTLDNIEIFMRAKGYSFLRLDGSTAVRDRTGLVKTFNESEQCFAFLLSSKAGGVGLNLIGANRLILLDPDWNPANDQQALARIWRPGQVNPVFIYRLVGARTIEEKILQRQAYKTTLAQVGVVGIDVRK
ncbi:hypothetical protein NCLIV_020290 [Neospora caninum Liverpool]|uniref:DNA repair and recombination protein RAD54B n=1 Tax=Neospora caninum (strain Liverpool) TaxID=572307 RepID=F0VEU9_NEOCL|nr:hypothetical protein NCLIV_020290 [Neospora caninum Liverpool]CBZ52243.1 hypothetical protein NCLIV_020290 [Neospora caninum Liverpool]CEL66211.1 TPA: DNA repair and recombination protein RAD54B [Neospora caninum Liverpool]|eukprot:XP_003882275.1 hypothetical protein NCLIV_020290 [Neospora caninum Liverpool]